VTSKKHARSVATPAQLNKLLADAESAPELADASVFADLLQEQLRVLCGSAITADQRHAAFKQVCLFVSGALALNYDDRPSSPAAKLLLHCLAMAASSYLEETKKLEAKAARTMKKIKTPQRTQALGRAFKLIGKQGQRQSTSAAGEEVTLSDKIKIEQFFSESAREIIRRLPKLPDNEVKERAMHEAFHKYYGEKFIPPKEGHRHRMQTVILPALEESGALWPSPSGTVRRGK
jgi:hypothetical protein